jgi:hypothetical protein
MTKDPMLASYRVLFTGTTKATKRLHEIYFQSQRRAEDYARSMEEFYDDIKLTPCGRPDANPPHIATE